MVTRRVAFLAAGALWLGLGILLILTVFGPLLGMVMAYFVGLRRNVLAARIGAGLGVLMFIPCQLILDVTGCRRDACSLEPYLLAYGLPVVVTVLNLVAGWPVRGVPVTASGLATAGVINPAPGPGAGLDVAPGQQVLWESATWEPVEAAPPSPDRPGPQDAPANADPAAATARMWSELAT